MNGWLASFFCWEMDWTGWAVNWWSIPLYFLWSSGKKYRGIFKHRKKNIMWSAQGKMVESFLQERESEWTDISFTPLFFLLSLEYIFYSYACTMQLLLVDLFHCGIASFAATVTTFLCHRLADILCKRGSIIVLGPPFHLRWFECTQLFFSYAPYHIITKKVGEKYSYSYKKCEPKTDMCPYNICLTFTSSFRLMTIDFFYFRTNMTKKLGRLKDTLVNGTFLLFYFFVFTQPWRIK